MIAVLVLPIWLTLRTVERPAVLIQTSNNPTPYGYTWSLTLWLVPLLAIVAWLHASPGYRLPRRAFWLTLAYLVPLGVVLDLAFGNAFFTFPNSGATLEIFVWGFDIASNSWVCNIPIEEFFFYLFGVAVALLFYLWADTVWLGRYDEHGAFTRPQPRPRLRPHWPSALLGVGLIVGAAAYKKLLSPDPCGFPGYFVFLVLTAFIPSSVLLRSVDRAINWRAFSFSATLMFLISVVWEATIAFPYGWWAYRSEMMIGEYISAWGGLPIEEPFLWLLVSFTVVIVFEAIHLDETWRRGQVPKDRSIRR
jgi:hypothetical protein